MWYSTSSGAPFEDLLHASLLPKRRLIERVGVCVKPASHVARNTDHGGMQQIWDRADVCVPGLSGMYGPAAGCLHTLQLLQHRAEL